MHHLSRFLPQPILLALATLLLAPTSLWPQDANFPDVDVTGASQEWYEEPIIWITSGVILLLLLWLGRRHWSTPK